MALRQERENCSRIDSLTPAGAWIPAGDKKPVTNKNDAALKEARSRLLKAHEHLVERLTKLRDGGGLTTSELDVLQRDISSFDPGLLEAGESLGGGGRYGPDTIASIRRREELATLVQEAWDSAPVPLPSELDPTETALGLKFQGVSTSELRVLTTGDAEEARHVARALEAAQELFRAVTGAEVSYPEGCRVFLLVRKEDKQAFLERHPKITPELRAWLATLEGAGVPDTGDWAFWEGDAEKRLDGMVRTAFDWLMRAGFQLTVDQAWIHEGLGLYLTHALVGTIRVIGQFAAHQAVFFMCFQYLDIQRNRRGRPRQRPHGFFHACQDVPPTNLPVLGRANLGPAAIGPQVEPQILMVRVPRRGARLGGTANKQMTCSQHDE